MTRILSDTQLRARVKLFGNLLGNVLRTQEDGDVLDAVETLRKGYIALRKEDSPPKRRRLEKPDRIPGCRNTDSCGACIQHLF